MTKQWMGEGRVDRDDRIDRTKGLDIGGKREGGSGMILSFESKW